MQIKLWYAPYPSQKFNEDGNPLSTERILNPKSALVTLASGLRRFSEVCRNGACIEIIDMQVEATYHHYKTLPYGGKPLNCYRLGKEFSQVESHIREGNIHGISANFTNGAQIVADFAKFIKRIKPSSLVVIGGTDASARPDYYLQHGADAVVIGEGEITFSRIVDEFACRGELQNIPFVQSSAAKPYLSADVDLKVNLNDILPMALDLVSNLSLYNDTGEGTPPNQVEAPYVCFETSRGCHHHCSFCTSLLRGRYRYMSPEAVKKHFDYFKMKGIKTILFQEDNILSRIHRRRDGSYLHPGGRDEVIQIFRYARDYGFTWEFANGVEFGKLMLPDGGMDHQLMEALFWNEQTATQWHGCYRVQIPLETLRSDGCSKFAKLRSFEEELEIIKAILGLGVSCQTYNLMIGLPDDTPQSLDEYMRKCLLIKEELSRQDSSYLPYFHVFNFTLLPGSSDYAKYQNLFAFDINEHPELISVYLSVLNTRHFSYQELFKKRLDMIRILNGDLIEHYDSIYCLDESPGEELIKNCSNLLI